MCGHVYLYKKKLFSTTQFELAKKILSNYPKQGSPLH